MFLIFLAFESGMCCLLIVCEYRYFNYFFTQYSCGAFTYLYNILICIVWINHFSEFWNEWIQPLRLIPARNKHQNRRAQCVTPMKRNIFKKSATKSFPSSNSCFYTFLFICTEASLLSVGPGDSSDTHVGITQHWTGRYLFCKDTEAANVCFPVVSLHHFKG